MCLASASQMMRQSPKTHLSSQHPGQNPPWSTLLASSVCLVFTGLTITVGSDQLFLIHFLCFPDLHGLHSVSTISSLPLYSRREMHICVFWAVHNGRNRALCVSAEQYTSKPRSRNTHNSGHRIPLSVNTEDNKPWNMCEPPLLSRHCLSAPTRAVS